MATNNTTSGPLSHIRVLELSGVGPVPHAAMLLADMGAEVIRVDRVENRGEHRSNDVLRRGKSSIVLDLKDPKSQEAVLQIVEKCDVLLEGNRPGVTERLRLGPEACFKRNPKLVYGRMTGWGQTGPRNMMAGHDLNYISIAGALGASGQANGVPQFALNLLGDFGGGSLYLVVGVLTALMEAQQTGRGQVVDAAIVDGTAHLLANALGMRSRGLQSDIPGQSLLDGGAPFYSVYQTADGQYVSVAAIEPQFFAILVQLTKIDFNLQQQNSREHWPLLRQLLQDAFASATGSAWEEVFEGTDACVSPVLGLSEVIADKHIAARGTIIEAEEGGLQPGIAPRFSRHPNRMPGAVVPVGSDTESTLANLTDVDFTAI